MKVRGPRRTQMPSRVQSAAQVQKRDSQDPAASDPSAAPNAAAQKFAFTANEVERRKRFVDLGHEDIARILTIRNLLTENVDRLRDAFFEYLREIEEAAPLFSNR